MSNEMKLLRAFIEASGFDVEEVRDFDESGYKECLSRRNNWAIKNPCCIIPDREEFNLDGYHKGNDYKVTKKKPVVDRIRATRL